jgi:hypothetical protein
MVGAGKYDDLCTEARRKAKAEGAILIILNGEKGQGFSVQATLDVLVRLPQMLRHMADDIEKDAITQLHD